VSVSSKGEIYPEYRETPVGLLLEYHNLNRPLDTYGKAQLLIGMCMDNRMQLRVPKNFAFIIRSGGANLRYCEFPISFAIACGGVKYITLIGHNNCRMANIPRKERFIEGLVDYAGCNKEWAEEHFTSFAPLFEIENEVDFILSEAKRLRAMYPKIAVVPMFYRIEDGRLYLIEEDL
jgi:carbonic anhydrase